MWLCVGFWSGLIGFWLGFLFDFSLVFWLFLFCC